MSHFRSSPTQPSRAVLACLFIACGGFSPGTAVAQTAQDAPPALGNGSTTDAEASTIVVTATLNRPRADEVAPSRALLREDAGALAPVTLLDQLSLIPGVVAFEKGGAGAGSYLSVRGGEPNFTLVTINGVRVNDPLQSAGGGFDFSLIGPGQIKRVDVLSGPYSTAYGADALSGVVALELGADRRKPVAISVGGGSGGRYDVAGSIALPQLSVGVSQSDSDDFLASSTARRRTVYLAAAPQLADRVALDLFALVADNDSRGFPEDSGGDQLAVLRDLETRERDLVVLGGTLAVGDVDSVLGQVRAGWTRSDLRSDAPGIAPGILDGVPVLASDSRFERFEAVGSVAAQLDPNFKISVGASIVEETGNSTGTIDFGVVLPTDYRLDRSLPGLFATVGIGRDDGPRIDAGLRVDWPSGGAAQWTPRVGAQLPIGDQGFEVKASYARGFKQPSLFALGFPLIANPALKDERSETIDAGVVWADPAGLATLSLTYFRSVFSDLIDFEPALFTNVNRDRVEAEGIEAAMHARLDRVSVRAALTHQSVRAEDGSTLRFRPDWTGRVAVNWQVTGNFDLRAEAAFSDGFFDSSIPTGLVRLGGYATLGGQARYRVTPNIELMAALRNATNTDFQRTVGTHAPGRNAYIGITTRF